MTNLITKDQVMISFPGIGIDEFIINKVAVKIGSIEIRWYGIVIAIGMLFAFLYASWRAKYYDISKDDVLDIGLFSVIFGVIGARLYYVVMEHEMYHSFYDVIAIWNGGLAIYGGIIGGAIAAFCVAGYKSRKNKSVSFRRFADITVPGVMVAQALGRWGNFFNGEAYGGVVPEDSFLYFLRMGIYPNNISGTNGLAYVHPTFLYESVWNLVGFVLINCFWKKKKFDGEVGLWYLTWYGFGRMFIEGLRTDSLYVGNIKISQLIGFISFVAGLGIIICVRVFLLKKKGLSSNEVISEEVQNTDSKVCDEEEKKNG